MKTGFRANKIILLAIALSFLAFGCNNKKMLKQEQTLQIKQYKITVQLADTPEKRAAGLSGVSAISDNEGMLFLFSSSQSPQFWMKGMLIPIDIIWIKGDKVVWISDNAKPEPKSSDEQLSRYSPTSPIDKVLEVNAGWAYRHDVGVGDTITVAK